MTGQFDEAAALIESFAGEHDLPKQPYGRVDFRVRVAFCRQLSELEPFKSLLGVWITDSTGGGGEWNPQRVGSYAYECLACGMTSREIVELARDQIAANSYSIFEVYDLQGITVSESIELLPNAHLVPSIGLPRDRNWEQTFVEGRVFDEIIPSRMAALVFQINIDRAATGADKSLIQERIDWAHERQVFLFDLMRAMAIAVDTPVGNLRSYSYFDTPNVLINGGNVTTRLVTDTFPRHSEPDMQLVKSYLDGLNAFTSKEAIRIAIDRFSRSRYYRGSVDICIDLGIALEVALMHNPRSKTEGKTEVFNKIGLRAGWLLGSNLEERLTAKNRASAIYNSRSNAVHNGTLDKKWNRADADDLVRTLLIQLLKIGHFPDWDRLVFGADP